MVHVECVEGVSSTSVSTGRSPARAISSEKGSILGARKRCGYSSLIPVIVATKLNNRVSSWVMVLSICNRRRDRSIGDRDRLRSSRLRFDMVRCALTECLYHGYDGDRVEKARNDREHVPRRRRRRQPSSSATTTAALRRLLTLRRSMTANATATTTTTPTTTRTIDGKYQ